MIEVDPNADTHEGNHTRKNQAEEIYGHFEVFWHDADDGWERGWYWWDCFPASFPSGDPEGPFATSDLAHENAEVSL